MVGRLAGTLRELTLIQFGNATFLADLPVMPRLEKCVLRYEEDDYIHALCESYTVRSEKMPALTYLEGVTRFDDEILSLPLHHLLLITDDYTFPRACETPMPSLLSMMIEGKTEDGEVDNLQIFPEWFGGAIFPNLQELHVWDFDEMSYLPASLASFTALTELSLVRVGYLSNLDGASFTQMARSILDPCILQITTLRTLNIIECDFKTLPPFFMPSLEFMRIAGCEHLYDFSDLSVGALPRLAVLELHNLKTIRTLPESLGQLSALTRLHISHCFLQSMPMSMHQLSALRELTIYTAMNLAEYSSLFRDVAIGLKGLYSLRKLCLCGSQVFSEADLIFIGRSLKAWPPPLLDMMDNKFPILGFRMHPQTRYAGHSDCSSLDAGDENWQASPYDGVYYRCIVPQRDPAPFNFKRCWSELGLPTEAADWDDGQIMHHWQTMQLKIAAFACIQHPRLCPTPLVLTVPGENIAMIGQLAGDWQRQHLREISKEHMSQREQASARDNARILADMRHHEHLLLLECQGLSPEIRMAVHAAWNEEMARADEVALLLEIETGKAPTCENRASWQARRLYEQGRELRNNAYMCRVRQEERARILTRMQALEPQ